MTLAASRRSFSSPEVASTAGEEDAGQLAVSSGSSGTARRGRESSRTLQVDEVEAHQAEREAGKHAAEEDEDHAEAELPPELCAHRYKSARDLVRVYCES